MFSNKKVKLLIRILFPVVLIAFSTFICFKNYTPGTYLIGWDSMHPEFNFSLNARRVLSHVWGSEMGVGAISAHSDMSDLPRILFLWASSIVVPESFIRYLFIFLCLIIGPLGMYFFAQFVFKKEKETLWNYLAASLAALFYLLNLGTLQNFFVPLEMFTVAFAGLPWLMLTGFKYLTQGGKTNLLLFSLVVILISPMAYAATQAYAIYLCMILVLFTFSIISKNRKLKLKRFFVLGIVSLLLNIYWIMPSVYSVLQQSLTISNANINRLFSPEAFLRNADYGNLHDILIQKSFLFSWRNFDFITNSYQDLMSNWNNYLAGGYVVTIGLILSAISLAGIMAAFVKRSKIGISLIPALVLSLFFLFNINPPFGGLYQYLYSRYTVFSEAFRTPFTKFSVLFEFILAFYFGYISFSIFSLKIRFTAFVKVLITGVLAFGLIYFMLPVFSGNLIGANVRVKFPDEYGELFRWFKTHSNGRVAVMPINSKYGWEYRNWGYEGSGFLTYGIKNPIFYRDFDRWNSANEDFYNQSAFALYTGNNDAFISTLKKYQVKYLLLDESIINAGGSEDQLKTAQIKEIASQYGFVPVASFGFLTVYDTGVASNTFSTPYSYTGITADLNYSPIDPVYQLFGDYTDGAAVFPFISLDKRSGVNIKLGSDSVTFSDVKFDIKIDQPATDSAKANLSINQGFPEAYNCDLFKSGAVTKEITPQGLLYQATGGGASCDYIAFPDLSYGQGYILHITGQNREGRGIKIYLFDSISQTPYLEEILPDGPFDSTFFIYPRNSNGKGYVLNFETRSFGRIASENLITGIEFYAVNYIKLANYKIGSVETMVNGLKVTGFKNYGDLIYKVNLTGTGLLEFNQGYEEGWIGLTIWNKRIKVAEHKEVNSWVNGWMIYGDSSLYIFYWPQLLEIGGLLVGVITLIALSIRAIRK